MVPAFGIAFQPLQSQYLPFGLVKCGDAHERVINILAEMAGQIASRQATNMVSVLLEGPAGLTYFPSSFQAFLEIIIFQISLNY